MAAILPKETVDALIRAFDALQFKPIHRDALLRLAEFEVVVIVDDSGSMGTRDGSIGGTRVSRWEELKYRLGKVADLLGTIDADGFDLFFLNRAGVRNVKEAGQVEATFISPPSGCTPTVTVRNSIQREYKDSEKPVLIMLYTDGAPSSMSPWDSPAGLKAKVTEMTSTFKFFFSINACTDNKREVAFLNTLDDIVGVDVIDDQASERSDVLAALKKRGINFDLSEWDPYDDNDHLVKSIVGGIDMRYDSMDDPSYVFLPPS